MAPYTGNMFRYILHEYTQNISKKSTTVSYSLQTKLNDLVPYLLCKFYLYLEESTYFRAYMHYLKYGNNYKTWHFINPEWTRKNNALSEISVIYIHILAEEGLIQLCSRRLICTASGIKWSPGSA